MTTRHISVVAAALALNYRPNYMTDFFDTAKSHLPKYLEQMGALLIQPKEFIRKLAVVSNKEVTDSIVFCCVSFLIGWSATIVVRPDLRDGILIDLAAQTAAVVVLIALASVALHVSWKLVGGMASYPSHLAVACYLSGVSTVIIVVFVLAHTGLMKMLSPELFEFARDNPWTWLRPNKDSVYRHFLDSQAAAGNDMEFIALAGLLSALIMTAGLIVMCMWIVYAWGGVREINSVTKGRSVLALAIYSVIELPLFALTALIGASLQR